MTHTFKNLPSGIIDYAVVGNERIYVGDEIVVKLAGNAIFRSVVPVTHIDVKDFKQSVRYLNPATGKGFWPHRGTYCKKRAS